MTHSRWYAAARAAGVHLAISILVACLLAAVVFGLWFPGPFRALAGGSHLFWIVIAVDVVCGPLLTILVFDSRKSRRALYVDMSVVAFLQLGALVYGVYTVSLARPVVLAYEVHRFAAVPAAWVETTALDQALPQFRGLSWTGPQLVGTRKPRNADEMADSVLLSLQGLEISARPGWWVPYAESVPEIQQKMRQLGVLRGQRSQSEQVRIDEAAAAAGLAVAELYYLPLTSRALADWIVLLDREAQIKGFAQVDGFEVK